MKKTLIKILSLAIITSVFLSVVSCGRKGDTGGEKVSPDTPWFDCEITECNVEKESEDLVEGQVVQFPIGMIPEGYVYALKSYMTGAAEVYLFSEDGKQLAEMDIISKVDETIPDLNWTNFEGLRNLYVEEDKLKLKVDNLRDKKIMIFDVDLYAGSISLSASYEFQRGMSSYRGNTIDRVKCGEYELFVSLYNDFCILIVGPDGETSIFVPGKELAMDLSGFVFDILPVSDTQVLFFDEQTCNYFLFDASTGTITKDTEKYDWIKPYYNWYRSDITCNFGSNGEAFFITPDAVAVPDFEKECINNIALLENIDINRSVFSPISQKFSYVINANENSMELMVLDYMPEKNGCGFELYQITRAKRNPHAGKTIITTDGYQMATIYDAVYDFNRTDRDYYVKLVPNIYTDDAREAQKYPSDVPYFYTQGEIGSRMMVDLMAGDCPDVVFYVTNYGQLNNGNCMMDLTQYYESSKMGKKVFDNIVNASKNNGGLYAMPLAFTLNGIIVDSSKYPVDGEGMTFEQFGEFTDKYCNGLNVVANTQTDFLRKCLNYQYDIIEHDGTIDFDCPEFREMAEYTCNYVNNIENNEYWNSFSQNRKASRDTNIEGYLGWFGTINNSLYVFDDAELVGFPSADGRGPAADICCFVSITQGSDCPNGAWRFIETLLSEDVQKAFCEQILDSYQSFFPINRNAFEEAGKDSVDIFNHNKELEYASWFGGSDNLGNYVNVEDLDKLKVVTESVNHIYRSDADIDIIVYEEIQPYLAGDKSLDEVIKIMNDRARTVLNERK